MKATALKWGLKHAPISSEPPALWGFRAIYYSDTGAIELLWDRVQVAADNDEAAEALNRVLRGPREYEATPFEKLKAWAGKKENRFDGGDRTVRTVDLGGVRFYVSPCSSHGYLYGTAHLIEPEAARA